MFLSSRSLIPLLGRTALQDASLAAGPGHILATKCFLGPVVMCEGRRGQGGHSWPAPRPVNRAGHNKQGVQYIILPVLSRTRAEPSDVLMNLHSRDENYCHCAVWAAAPEVFSGHRGGQIPPWCATLASAPPGSAPTTLQMMVGSRSESPPSLVGGHKSRDLLARRRAAISRFMSKTKRVRGPT